MCGIVGYVGKGDASTIVFEGLRRLEYRGYDSAGIAVVDGDTIELRRSVGKLDGLGRAIAEAPLSGSIGIGHTRWATHGRPSEVNAHPHIDCRRETVVIHNGIVENYLPLRQRLRQQGHVFGSETDTEVIVHLLEENLKQGMTLEEAVRCSLREIKGAHAVVAMSLREPDKIIAARLGNAGGVVVGLGEGENFVASDMPAILPHTRHMVFLGDRELAVLTSGGATYSTVDGDELSKEPHFVTWDPVMAAKGGYKHFMLKEIHEQSRALTDTIAGRVAFDPASVIFEQMDRVDGALASVERLVLVACGTAWHACLVGKFMIEELAGVPVEVDYASEFRYRDPLIDRNTLLVAVTQSGETVDTLVSMEAAKSKGAMVVGIVNVVGSMASRVSDAVVYTHAGPEIGVASTKAFTSQLAALYLFAAYLGQRRGRIGADQMAELLREANELPHHVGDMLARPAPYEELANRYFRRSDFLYLGRGINYPIALEGALKLKEISYIHAEGYPAGEMKHGPIALIDEDMPVVVVAPRDRVYDKVLNNVEQVKARSGVVIAVASDGDDTIIEKADHVIYIPRTSYYLTPILAVVPLQLLAYYIAVRRGADVDQPRNLAKSVTVE